MTKVQLLYSRHNNYFIPGAHNSTYWAKNHDQPCDHQYVQTSDSSEEEIVLLTESDVPGVSQQQAATRIERPTVKEMAGMSRSTSDG